VLSRSSVKKNDGEDFGVDKVISIGYIQKTHEIKEETCKNICPPLNGPGRIGRDGLETG
jgi:hypothetical protein